ncbi:hypothetical protein [Paracidovorax konjaci]|uniref:Uncharacterized protein n=1 Tax=Paracidovorax konjaci TaxID=32040 RepID=A0A1I1TWQ7_9BURK|nr:hypothetical protein [Paracidovorax konjaci]SFD63061.1 hypothetical protein SAMN04489710_104123 [Paracidovorax konjaci]
MWTSHFQEENHEIEINLKEKIMSKKIIAIRAIPHGNHSLNDFLQIDAVQQSIQHLRATDVDVKDKIKRFLAYCQFLEILMGIEKENCETYLDEEDMCSIASAAQHILDTAFPVILSQFSEKDSNTLFALFGPLAGEGKH